MRDNIDVWTSATAMKNALGVGAAVIVGYGIYAFTCFWRRRSQYLKEIEELPGHPVRCLRYQPTLLDDNVNWTAVLYSTMNFLENYNTLIMVVQKRMC